MFVIDLETGSFQLSNVQRVKGFRPRYSEEEESGRVFSYELTGEGILKGKNKIKMESVKHKQESVKVNELEGEPVEIDLNRVREVEVELQKQVIEFPGGAVQTFTRVTKILEGFTEGALKNIITVSERFIWLYSVTLDAITLLCCTEIEGDRVKRFFKKNLLTANQSILLHRSKSSIVQLIFGNLGKTVTLKFCGKNGKLLKTQISNIQKNSHLEGIRIRKLGRENSYQAQSFYLDGKKDSVGTRHLGLNHIYRTTLDDKNDYGLDFKKWMSLDKIITRPMKNEKKIFENQLKLSTISQEIKDELKFSEEFRRSMHPFNTNNHSVFLLILSSSSHIFFFLIDLRRRKLLKRSSLSLLDLLTKEQIEEIQDEGERAEVEQEEGQDYVWFDTIDSDSYSDEEERGDFEITDETFIQGSRTIIVTARFNGVNFRIRREDIFDKVVSAHEASLLGKRWFGFEKNSLLSLEGGLRILTRSSGDDDPTSSSRTLKWLNPETLEEEKIEGLEETDFYWRINCYQGDRESHMYDLISSNRLLIIGPTFALIYDISEHRQITTFTTDYEMTPLEKQPKLDRLHIESFEDYLRVYRLAKLEDDQVVVHKVKSIYPKEHFQDFTFWKLDSEYKKFRLPSGNYHYLNKDSIRRRVDKNRSQEAKRFFSLEIDPHSLEVVKSRKVDQNNRQNRKLSFFGVEQIHFVSNYFIFPALVERHINRSTKQTVIGYSQGKFSSYPRDLILTNLDFEMLDHSSQAKFTRGGIKAISSSNRVISLNETKSELKIYLHDVDLKKEKVVLLKSVAIDSRQFLFNSPASYGLPFFCCGISAKNEGETKQSSFYHVFLNFDWGLNLVGHLKFRGYGAGKSVYPLSCSSIAEFGRRYIGNVRQRFIYLIDMEERSIKVVHEYALDARGERLETSEESGRIWNTVADSWSIERFFLN